jgi:type VI secretion system protein ImpC
MSGHLDFEMRWGRGRSRPRESEPGARFDIVVVADLGGASGTLISVDAATFDDVFARVAPRATLTGAAEDGGGVSFSPRAYEDLHADRLLETVPSLSALRRLAEAASDPSLFPVAFPAPEAGGNAPGARPDEALLDRLLGAKPGRADRGAAPLDAWIRGIVAPHLTPGPKPRQKEVLDAVAAASVDRLRAVLRQDAFRRLEATWTAVRRLAFRMEDEGPARLRVIGLPQDALVADALAAGSDGVPPKLHAAVERAITAGELAGRGLLVVDCQIEATAAHLALAARLAALARAVGMPVVAGAAPSLLGAASATDLEEPSRWSALPDDVGHLWSALRSSELGRWIALVTPRVVARPPYGARIEPVARLDFEEVGDDPGLAGFNWMNGAFVAAEFVAAAVAEGDTDALNVAGRATDDFPFVAYSVADGRKLQPAVEAVLSDRASDRILGAGIVPLRADPSRAAVILPRLQSIADPATRLGG